MKIPSRWNRCRRRSATRSRRSRTMLPRQVVLLGIILVVLSGVGARGDVKLPAVISDNMVLQQGRQAAIWGTADAGEQVTVSLGEQEQTATADANGQWKVELAPLTSFAIAGVIWYQGEANSPSAYHYRKAFTALIERWRRTWGEGDFPLKVEYSGPTFESLRSINGMLRLRFGHANGGLVARGATVVGFQIAGEDQNFFEAKARIEGNTIVLASPNVPKPVAARYAWANDPPCNLYNRANLPAAPFRTDDWPVPTQGEVRKTVGIPHGDGKK